jgi:LysM domain-containing protein
MALILLCAMIATLALGLQAVLGGLGGGPLTTSGPPGSGAVVGVLQPAAMRTYTVQAGDTLWSIARGLSDGGDPRPIVDRLMAQRQGRPLQVGERIALP